MSVVCEHGKKVSGTRNSVSPSDHIIGGTCYELKIFFGYELPSDLVGRICDGYQREIETTVEAFFLHYASVTPTTITLHLEILNSGVEYEATAQLLIDLFRKDLAFEGHEPTDIGISKIEIQRVNIFPIFLVMIFALILIVGLGKKK